MQKTSHYAIIPRTEGDTFFTLIDVPEWRQEDEKEQFGFCYFAQQLQLSEQGYQCIFDPFIGFDLAKKE